MKFNYSSSLRRVRLALLGLGLAVITVPQCVSAADEPTFDSPEAAVQALVSAAKNNDTNAIHAIFGPAGRELMSPDLVQATAEYQRFVERLTKKTRLVKNSDTIATLELGTDGWPFPIPLVNQNGQWFFDTAAGKVEILNRRIGMDELGAIAVCNAYVDAQNEYARADRMGDGVHAYAQNLRSTTGTHDGLFWPTNQTSDELSPLGPLIAQAHMEGYRHSAHLLNDQSAPYHGYYFKILTRQGQHAPGGKYRYLIHGRMIAGFALVAWPAEWKNTGVMTFIVNQQGQVYQKNLGPGTVKLAGSIKTYDPDDTWTPVN
ncbi:MAG TPA: DUF2950 domain-containing protein [Verrucomicrobiae bacterium]